MLATQPTRRREHRQIGRGSRAQNREFVGRNDIPSHVQNGARPQTMRSVRSHDTLFLQPLRDPPLTQDDTDDPPLGPETAHEPEPRRDAEKDKGGPVSKPYGELGLPLEEGHRHLSPSTRDAQRQPS